MSSQIIFFLVFLTIGCKIIYGQNDGRYRPNQSNANNAGKAQGGNDGKYRPNDGKYKPTNDGKYNGDDGRYVHKDVGYKNEAGKDGSNGDSNVANNNVRNDANNRNTYNNQGVIQIGGRSGIGGINSVSDSKPAINKPTKPILNIPPKVTLPTQQPAAVSADGTSGWQIIRQEQSEDEDGYHYLFETENGILAEESGRIEKLSSGDDGLRSTGFYQYIGDDGVLYRVDYVADDNGFVPQGEHLPKTPPAIQKLLDYLSTQPPPPPQQ